MRSISSFILIISLFVLLFACNSSTPVITDEAAYVESIKEWQEQRIERLKSKNGWLSLAGLFWLEEGENSFGSDSENDIVFPEKPETPDEEIMETKDEKIGDLGIPIIDDEEGAKLINLPLYNKIEKKNCSLLIRTLLGHERREVKSEF